MGRVERSSLFGKLISAIVIFFFVTVIYSCTAKPPPPPSRSGTARIYGHVTFQGQPLSGVRVIVDGHEVDVSNPNGEYSVAKMPPGTSGLRFIKRGFKDRFIKVDLHKGESKMVNVRMSR